MRWGECEGGGRDLLFECRKSLSPLRRRPGRHTSVLYYLLPFPDRFGVVLFSISACRRSASKNFFATRQVSTSKFSYFRFMLFSTCILVSFGVAFTHLSQGGENIPLSVASGRVLPPATTVACGGCCRVTYPRQCGNTKAVPFSFD